MDQIDAILAAVKAGETVTVTDERMVFAVRISAKLRGIPILVGHSSFGRHIWLEVQADVRS